MRSRNVQQTSNHIILLNTVVVHLLDERAEDVLVHAALLFVQKTPNGLGPVVPHRVHVEHALAVARPSPHRVEERGILVASRQLLQGVIRRHDEPLGEDLATPPFTSATKLYRSPQTFNSDSRSAQLSGCASSITTVFWPR